MKKGSLRVAGIACQNQRQNLGSDPWGLTPAFASGFGKKKAIVTTRR
ncbi:MAG: hypothetical protein V4724_13480 [Pseudomonadota bacterium]